MKKVDRIVQEGRPCNFNDFYYFPKHFDDKGIEAIHEMVRRGGYKFEKGGIDQMTAHAKRQLLDKVLDQHLALIESDDNWHGWQPGEKEELMKQYYHFFFDVYQNIELRDLRSYQEVL